MLHQWATQGIPEPKTLEDTIRKATYCHEQYGHRAESREN
jgi:hypothetical protein